MEYFYPGYKMKKTKEGPKSSVLKEVELLDTEEDWQVICEQSLFSNRLHQLEEICIDEFRGISINFINSYLRPVVELLDHVRSECEEYYGQQTPQHDTTTPSWVEKFENIVKYAIHPSCLKTSLKKGDFYIHISSSLPRTLVLKYYQKGLIYSKPLSVPDSILMCSENWVELLRSEIQFQNQEEENSIYKACILWTSRGFEKASWLNLLRGRISRTMETIENDKPTNMANSDMTSTQIDNSNTKDSTINVEELTLKPILILDLNFELLHSQVAYLPGSQDKRGGPVIYFETNKTIWENADLSSEELAKLLIYYYKIVREPSQRLGCSLVIDARESKQSRDIIGCIGESIQMFEEKIPGAVHMAYAVTRKDSLMLLFKASKIKENLNFQFRLFSSIDKLSREIDITQLPKCFGGHLEYNHEKWIKFRTKIEPFMTGCRSAAKRAMNYIQQLSRTDLGNTLEECKQFLEEHRGTMKEVLDDERLHSLRTEGKSILTRLEADEVDAYHKTDDYAHTIECLHRLYNQMTRVFDRLQLISERRMSNLELHYKIRKFEENSSKVHTWLSEEGIPRLEKDTDIGDSLETSRQLLDKFVKFGAQADVQIACGIETLELGNYLITSEQLVTDRETLTTRRDELQVIFDEFNVNYTARSKKMHKSFQFQQLLSDGTNWWMSGLQYIAKMSMEDIQTIEGITRLRESLEQFLVANPKCEERQIARLTELAHHLGSKQVEAAEQVNSKCLEVEAMLQAKQNQILGAETRLRQTNRNSQIYSDGDEHSSGFKDDDLSTEPDDEEFLTPSDREISVEPMNMSTDDYEVTMSWWGEAERPYDENDSKLAVFDAAMPTKMKQRLYHIIDEMISTEAEYVNSLEYILINYLPEMVGESVPPFLKGKKNMLFGNIERIYEFHKRFFSQEVVTYRHAPLQIGKCFLKWERQFYLYALYNKNKPKSDQLWLDFGNSFFQAKMKELNDKLDLASYLIKPVQRLGKYALLLRDMITCCDEKDPRVVELNSAHELMKFQLRHGNDLLAMDSIKQSDVNLKEQGCLLRQGEFIVWYGRRKRLQRVFLFEHVLVFTKPRREKAKGDTFMYKHSIKMVDLGLTENIGDSGVKFEVWYRRWKKRKSAETYVLQAATEEMKSAWTTDITRILWRQASRNKEYGLTEATTGISVESTPSSVFFDPSVNHTSYTRTPSRRGNEMANNKRLSWLSAGESSGSSGVHDLGSLPEDTYGISPRAIDDNRSHFNRGDIDKRYKSLPKKKISHQTSSPLDKTQIVVDTSQVQLRRNVSSAGYEGSFIRNNVFRRTVQLEPSHMNNSNDSPIRPPRTKATRRPSGGRFATQPIVLPSAYVIQRAMSPDHNKPIREEDISGSSNSIPNSLTKSFTGLNLSLDSDRNNNASKKTRTNSSKSEPSTARPLSPALRKSYTDNNLLEHHKPVSFRNHSRSLTNETDVSPRDAYKRRSSFNKAISVSYNISVDEKDARRNSRMNISLSTADMHGLMKTSDESDSNSSEFSPRNSTPRLVNLKEQDVYCTLIAVATP